MSQFVKRIPGDDEIAPPKPDPNGGSSPAAPPPAAANPAPSPSPAALPADDEAILDLDALDRASNQAPLPSQPAGPATDAAEMLDLDALEQGPDWSPPQQPQPALPQRSQRRRGRRLVQPPQTPQAPLSPQQRLLLLDTWQRSGLPAADFAALVGLSKYTLYAWKQRFEEHGPAGLMDKPRGQPAGSRLPELTKRTILMLKAANPQWGCQKISDLLLRGPALPASPAAVARVLHEAGYQLEETPTRPHEPPVRHFERARPNQLWQTDLFTFILKRQNRRVYLVAFLDDHSRFIVGYGLHASQSAALVLEVLRASISAYGTPEEVLTDNGTQYVTWRGKSAFAKELDKRGIAQVVASPRRPQTLGKIERFWGSLWRECVEAAVFLDLEDARRRIGLYIDSYNFQRPHQGIDGLTPADRYFGAAEEVKRTLAARVAANAMELARQGLPRTPFYLTGQVGGRPFSVHAEGERVILTSEAGARREVELTAPPAAQAVPSWPEPVCPGALLSSFAEQGLEQPAGPGQSPLDEGLQRLRQQLPEQGGPS
jgi:transposase InsO family protein